jgi:hypothetical protein
MTSPSVPDTSALPEASGAMVQWLGFTCQGGRYALPLANVAAVFKPKPSTEPSPRLLDIEVHDGAPVFIRSFQDSFALLPSPWKDASLQDHHWVLVLQSVARSAVGFRIGHVVGPFWASALSEHVSHDGLQWQALSVPEIGERVHA